MSESMNRRTFLEKSSLLGLAAATGLASKGISLEQSAPAVLSSRRDLEITRIVVQDAPGRRATPVAPNAYAEYRGYRVREPLVRLQTNQGIEGVTRAFNAEDRRETLDQLLGMNPFDLFEWEDGIVVRPAPAHRELASSLRSFDIALFDLLGRATRKPVADLLGERVHESVHVYDSCLYMEDLLTPAQRQGLAYLDGRQPPRDPAELPAYKADWLVNDFYREEGVRIYKIKTGRAEWMDSYEEALERDIEVFRAIRRAVGPHVTLLVDVNNGYAEDYTAAKRFIEETSDLNLFGIEEMFPEERVGEHREVVEHAYDLGLKIRNIDGETGGVDFAFLEETLSGPNGEESIFDINNPSFSHGLGFIQIRDMAERCRALGVTVGPHCFASKIGLYASVHLGLTVPNWEYVETDDSHFPALAAPGIQIRNGKARLTGTPGLGVALDEAKLDAPSLVLEV